MNGDVKFIQGRLYYQQDGNWYPVPLIGAGGGGRRGPQGIQGPAGPTINIITTITHNDGGVTFTAIPSGGTPNYSYQWSVVSTGVIFGSNYIITGGGTTDTVTVSGSTGMMRVDVTDANGIKSSAYFLQAKPGV